MNVLTNGKADISAITEIRYVNSTAVIVKTRVPISQFDFERPDASIVVAGSVELNLKGGKAPERKLMLASGPDDRRLQSSSRDKAVYDVTIGLTTSEPNSDGGIVVANSATMVVVHVSLITIGVMVAAWY